MEHRVVLFMKDPALTLADEVDLVVGIKSLDDYVFRRSQLDLDHLADLSQQCMLLHFDLEALKNLHLLLNLL